MFSEAFFFIFFSTLLLFFSIFVIISKNPVHSILCLVLLFFNAAGLLILLGIDFLGMLFLIIYIGAIAVLFLFVVMMLNIKITNQNSLAFRFFITFFFFFCFFFLFFFEFSDILSLQVLPFNFYFNPLIIWCYDVKSLDNIFNLGSVLYTFYFYLFLLCGIILLLSMLGSITLTLHKRNEVKKQQIYKQIEKNFDIVIKWKA